MRYQKMNFFGEPSIAVETPKQSHSYTSQYSVQAVQFSQKQDGVCSA